MKELNTKQLKSYLKTLEFGLKDFEKTKQKYESCQPEKWKAVKNQLAKNFIINNQQYIVQYRSLCQYCDPKELTKSSIRHLRTNLNSIVYVWHQNCIKEVFQELNDNEIHNFAIKFYIDNYDKINKEMKRSLFIILDNLFNLQ